MKVLMAAGGTGGHIYPGVAVAKEIMARDASSEVLFVGTARGLERSIVPDNGFQLSLIHSVGLKNVGIAGKLKGIAVLPTSFVEAWKVLRDFRPHVVVGVGGYVTGPVLMTAHFMGFPTLIMDSNALPGFTNRQLARFVDKAALTFDAALPFFGKKGVVTGNPVRPEFFTNKPREIAGEVNLLVFGGSQGAKAINEAVVAALPLLKDKPLAFMHQTGETAFDAVRQGYETAGVEADIRPYISNMADAFDASDILICRAGATTCAEIAAAGKAAIMVPLPTAADDHQRKNAEAMVANGAARMILQSELSGERLASEIASLIADPESIRSIGEAARTMATPDAAKQIVDMVEKLNRE